MGTRNVRGVRFAMMLGAAAMSMGIAHDALATGTCEGGGGTYSGGTPTLPYCNTLLYSVQSGPGAGILAQDQSTSTTGETYGLQGTSEDNTGVMGLSVNGDAYGMVGLSGTTSVPSEEAGVGGVGSGSGVFGVYGTASGADSIHGAADGGYAGVYGGNTSTNSLATGVFGDMGTVTSGSGAGVMGKSASGSGYGVYGTNTTGEAIYGDYTSSSGTANGVKGVSGSSSTASAGVYGDNTGSGYGLHGVSTNGIGVYGLADSGASGAGFGVEGVGPVIGGYFYTNAAGQGAIGLEGSDGGADECVGVQAVATGANSYALFVQGNGVYTGTWGAYSDERLKKDIAPVKDGLDELLKFRPVTFKWQEPSKHGNLSGMRHGFIAQDVEKIHADWVHTDHDGFKTLDVTGLEAMEVHAIQTLKVQLDEERAKRIDLEDQFQRYLRGEKPAGSLPAWLNFNYILCVAVGALGTYALNLKKKLSA
jgi:hypothetical protein